MFFATAVVKVIMPPLSLDCFFMSSMTLEGTSQAKFTQLMTNHVFRNVHRNVLFTVMYSNRQTYKLRQHRRTARPGFYRALIIGCAYCLNLLEQMCINKWTFFNGTCHV